MSPESLDFSTNFTNLDWAIVALYLLGTLVVGVHVNRYIRNMADYVVAGRAVKWRLGVATMIGTELGLVTIMYMAQKGFGEGFSAFQIGLGAAVVTLMVGLTGFLVVPLRAMGVMTIPEFYEKRFTRGVRLFGGIVLAMAGILNMGMFIKAGAVFIQGATGLGGETEIVLKLIMTAMLLLVLLYTVLGGMVSVVITDFIQFVVVSFGLLLTCGLALKAAGGWDALVKTVSELKGESGFNPFHAESIGPTYVVWMLLIGLWSCAVWQPSVMRACAAESTAAVKRLYVWSSIGFLIRFMIPQFLGICALAHFHTRPEWAAHFSGEGDTLAAMPIFLGKVLPVGIIGIITAGMLAAFMSTHDSYLLSWSSVITQDIVAPILGGRLSTKARLLLTRAFILIIGFFILVWGLWYPLGQDLWDYLAVSGTIYFAGGFAVLGFGIHWRRASSTGAHCAIATGLTVMLGLAPVKGVFWDVVTSVREMTLHELRVLAICLETIDAAVIAVGGTLVSLIMMVLGSLIFPDRERGAPTVPAQPADPVGKKKAIIISAVVAAVLIGLALTAGSWQGFWAAVLVITLAIFAILAVVVAVGGFLDIRAMFRGIEDQHGEATDAQ